jgi:hypothetical protein
MNMPKSRRTLYLTDEAFEELQKRSPNISQEVDGFIRKRVQELNGHAIGEDPDYEGLKVKYSELVSKVAKKDEQLKEKKPNYHNACELLADLGLKADFSNADELIPQFMSAWKGDVEFMHEYVTLVELTQDKRQTERILRTIRSRPKDPEPSTMDKEQRAATEVDSSQPRPIVSVACPGE